MCRVLSHKCRLVCRHRTSIPAAVQEIQCVQGGCALVRGGSSTSNLHKNHIITHHALLQQVFLQKVVLQASLREVLPRILREVLPGILDEVLPEAVLCRPGPRQTQKATTQQKQKRVRVSCKLLQQSSTSQPLRCLSTSHLPLRTRMRTSTLIHRSCRINSTEEFTSIHSFHCYMSDSAYATERLHEEDKNTPLV